jgi:predicted XRE-type DNA-binding protein
MHKVTCMTNRLSFKDAVEVWLRHWAGEFQHRIAASYDVNQGRISDVINERLHIGSKKVAEDQRS